MALNNESVVEQDLVAWVMLGIVHVPCSEVSTLQHYVVIIQYLQQKHNVILAGFMLEYSEGSWTLCTSFECIPDLCSACIG